MMAEEIRIARDSPNKPLIIPVRINYKGPLIEPIAAILDPLQYFPWKSEEDNTDLVAQLIRAIQKLSVPLSNDTPLKPLGSGTGAMPLDSSLYIVRDADEQLDKAIEINEGIIRIKGSRQVGKTSLLNRALHTTNQKDSITVVRTDYQAFAESELGDLPTFYKALANKLLRALRGTASIPKTTTNSIEKIDAVWDESFSPNDNLQDYLEFHVLEALPGPLLWGMDEVDRLFTTTFKSDVFGLFRSWYNLRNSQPNHPLSNLMLILSYATEASLFITDLNQSPFNVGVNIPLDDFTESELVMLNQHFGKKYPPIPLHDLKELARFQSLVGGHPYLAHRGLIELKSKGCTLEKFEASAATDTGPFRDHLRRILFSTSEELLEVLKVVTEGKPCPDDQSFYRLCEAGVLSGTDYRQPKFRCGIYKTYLTQHLQES